MPQPSHQPEEAPRPPAAPEAVLAGLVRVGRELVETRDPARVAERIVATVLGLVAARHAILFRLDPSDGSLICLASSGERDTARLVGQVLPPGTGLSARVLAERGPAWVPDVLADPAIHYPAWLERVIREEGLRAVAGVPLLARGRPLGILAVSDGVDRCFSPEELALLATFADQAAAALENAQLYDDLGRELKVRRQAEEALQRYRLLSDRARDIMLFVRRSDGRVLEANAAAVEAYGYTPMELLGLRIQDLRAPQTQRQIPAQLAQADAGGILFETIHRRKDGSTFPVEVSSRGTGVGGERVLLSVIRDISARRASEAERARLGQAVEQAAEVVMITDLAGIIQYVNPAFERVTGYRREEVLGRDAGLLQGGPHPEEVSRGMWEALGRGETWSGSFLNRRKDGSRYEEEAVISPVRDATGEVVSYVAVKRDVTRERQMEAQLRQAQKMEAVGRLAGGVAHDFNNVLMAILGHCDLLGRRLDGDSPLREEVEEIRQAAERAAGLTRQLLTFSRRQVVQAGPLDLNGVLRGIDRLLTRLWGENIRPVHRLAVALGPIWADRGQVEQIVMNLAVNARDAMPDGGVLTLATAEVDVGEGLGRPADLPPGRYVTLTVADTGIGMDAEVQTHLFEPFFTTKPTGLGTGLGLATVYGIVRQCGGGITVESAPGHGTTVTVYFPRSAAPAPAAPPPPPPAPAEPTARETILLAEDDPGVRAVVREVLRMRGYTVLEAADGFEALRVAGEHPGRVDLLLTDVVMPGMRGPTLVEQLLPLRPGIRVLYMSGYPDDSFVRQGVRGAKHFLQKPFTTEALTRMVRQALDWEPPGGTAG